MDKSWIYINNRRSDEFWNGLQAFMKQAENYQNSLGQISCPCRKCLNKNMLLVKEVNNHIFHSGFDLTYQTWIHHGEAPSSWSPHTDQHVTETVDEMDAVLNDIAREVDANDFEFCTSGDEDGPLENDEFKDLLSELQQELYPGCNKYSSLNFLVKLMHLKVLYKWPNECMDAILKLLRDAFPDGNRLPTSHYESKRLLSKLGLGYKAIHACRYDCAIFWKENANMQECPICKTSRWKLKKGKKVPWKVLRYFPLKDRLKRLFTSRHTAKEMTWHESGRSKDSNLMRHPVDGKEWKEFDTKYPDFACETRNVRLGLATDGFNPFGSMSLSYSMWPVVVTVYNLPPWLCTKDPYKLLTLLISGPHAPGKDIDIFLRPLVDELQELWTEGVNVFDAATNTNFRMRAALLMTVSDFPARSCLSGWSGQGYNACPTCNDETPSMRITNKISYVGHRQWLPINHPLRKNKRFNGKVDARPPPLRKTTHQIMNQMKNVGVKLPGKHESYGGKKRKRNPLELNWNKKSIFWELPYWTSLSLRHNLDVMHIEKNVCESLLGTILKIDGKNKDTDKARIDLQNMGVRKELHLYKEGDNWMKPHASYTLTAGDSKKFYDFLKQVRFPDNFASNLRKNVIEGSNKITGLKSHDCHIILQRLLPIGIRPFMKKEIVDAITEFSNFFQLICSRTLKISDLEKAREEIIIILCKLETIFPPAFFDIMVHLVMHLPEEAIQGGPVHLRWMYPIERFLGSLKKYVKNRARPEGSIAEAYIVTEALTFCSMYLTGIETRFNRPERNWVDEVASTRRISVFHPCTRPLGKMSQINLDNDLRSKAEWYILQNCPEIQHYMDDHKKDIEQQNFGGSLEEKQLREFPKWFHNKMFALRELKVPEATNDLVLLSFGSSFSVKIYPGCIVNGVKFLTQSRDINRTTQNSGISVRGADNQVFYGILDDIYELNYGDSANVVLFKCKWFDTNPRKKKVLQYKNKLSIYIKDTWYENEPFILASQAEQVFYIDDLFNGPNWKVVEHFGHRHIWESQHADTVDVEVVQDVESSRIELLVEIPNIDSMTLDQSNVPSNIVTSGVEEIMKDIPIMQEDDFIDDGTRELYEYNEHDLTYNLVDEDDDDSSDDDYNNNDLI